MKESSSAIADLRVFNWISLSWLGILKLGSMGPCKLVVSCRGEVRGRWFLNSSVGKILQLVPMCVFLEGEMVEIMNH